MSSFWRLLFVDFYRLEVGVPAAIKLAGVELSGHQAVDVLDQDALDLCGF
jgi:hypothetical protein